MSKARRLAFLAIAAALALASAPGLASALDDVAVSGGATPDFGFVYKSFQHLQVSDPAADVVVFYGSTTNTTTRPKQNRQCIFRVPATGGGTALACRKDASPTGDNYQDFDEISTSASGETVWLADVGNAGVRGIFHETGKVVVTGDPAPGGGTFREFSFVGLVDAADYVVFKATLDGVADAVNQGIFKCARGADFDCGPTGNGTLTRLMVKNDAVPGRAGREFCQFNEMAASDWGIVFRAGTKTDCASDAEGTRQGLFRLADGGGVEVVVIETEAAVPEGQWARFIGRPDIQNDGFIVFIGGTRLSGAEAGTRVYLCDPATCGGNALPPGPAVVAVPARAVVPGGIVKKFKTVAINDGGEIVFIGEGTAPCGVYVRHPDTTITAVAQRGDSVPGQVATFRCFASVAASNGGHVAIHGTFKKTKGTGQGIFLAE
jgi:hypothetical protein